jgi:hypothetical protein
MKEFYTIFYPVMGIFVQKNERKNQKFRQDNFLIFERRGG